MVLKPWDQRARTSWYSNRLCNGSWPPSPANRSCRSAPPLPGGVGLPVQFVLGTTEPFAQLNDITQDFLRQALASGLFIFLNTTCASTIPR